LQLVPLLEVLNQNGVRYLVKGSTAAIIQDVDLPLTDLDVVPATDAANLRRLGDALRELGASERRGEQLEAAEEIFANPLLLSETTFWTFSTVFGDLDIVLRPAGFEAGYLVLLGRVDGEDGE
jgi:hypothetical protein